MGLDIISVYPAATPVYACIKTQPNCTYYKPGSPALLHFGRIAYASGCIAYTSGCIAYTSGCIAYASGCIAYASGCIAYIARLHRLLILQQHPPTHRWEYARSLPLLGPGSGQTSPKWRAHAPRYPRVTHGLSSFVRGKGNNVNVAEG